MNSTSNFDRDFSFFKLILSVLFHIITSLIIGPLIAIILFILWGIAVGQGGIFAEFISEQSLVGYWFVIITLLMFGLVWLGFFNNRKDSGLSSIKCFRWWTEFWMNSKSVSSEIPDLPSEGEEHFDVKIIKMDKKLPYNIGLLVLTVMSSIVSIIIYFTRDSFGKILPVEIQISSEQWILGFLVFIVIAIGAIAINVYLIYKFFYLVNKRHFYWRRFWLGLILYTIRLNYNEFNEETSENEGIISYVDGFKTKYNSIASEIDSTLKNIDFPLDYKSWLENKLEELDKSPTFLIPRSLSTIGTFYGFTLLIAGSFGDLIVGPATEVLRIISGVFI